MDPLNQQQINMILGIVLVCLSILGVLAPLIYVCWFTGSWLSIRREHGGVQQNHVNQINIHVAQVPKLILPAAHRPCALVFPPNSQTAVKINLSELRVTVADHEYEQCCICMVNKKNVVYGTCNHLLICSVCAEAMDIKCPGCRTVSTYFFPAII